MLNLRAASSRLYAIEREPNKGFVPRRGDGEALRGYRSRPIPSST
jgi:hypothetical protein